MQTTIDIYLKKKEDFYSKYSKEKLNKELFDYIYDECYGENYKNKIVINIYSEVEINNAEKHNMMDIVRRTFGLRVQDELVYYEKTKDIQSVLFLVGIALIILYYIANIDAFRNIVLILGWLAIWEAIYSFLTKVRIDYIYIYKLKQLANARVYFYDASKRKINRGMYKIDKEKKKDK